MNTRVPTEPGDYRGYYINLRDAIHGNAALEVTPLQAWRTMRVLEMAGRAAAAVPRSLVIGA